MSDGLLEEGLAELHAHSAGRWPRTRRRRGASGAFLPSMCTLLLLLVALVSGTAQVLQAPLTEPELAEYRLTAEVFERFVLASGLISRITADDPRFRYAPLFTEEVAVSGDAPMVAMGLMARLQNNPALEGALTSANMNAREYTQFVLGLLAARLAYGFMEAGVLRRVPAGAAADNVAFVGAHTAEITLVLKQLGVE